MDGKVLFVIWMLGFPIIADIGEVLTYGFPYAIKRDEYRALHNRSGAITPYIVLAIWTGVGYLLWNLG